MNNTKWDRLTVILSSDESARLKQTCNDKGLSVNSVLYSLLYKITDGFRTFDQVPSIDAMPRGVVVRKSY